jgi:hypothetical protein
MIGRKMKGFDEFIIVLAIALILLVAFALLAPYLPGGEPEEKFTLIERYPELGNVGFSEDVAAKVSRIGEIKTGELQTESLKYLKKVEFSTGYFGSEYKDWIISVPEHFRDSLEKITISFEVDETNYYGSLIVDWNGRHVFERVAGLTKYSVEIPKDSIGRENTLKIYASSPGLYFWASTVYKLKDLKVELGYGPSKLYAFYLTDKDRNSFSKGEIEAFGVGSSPLEVSLNGMDIFDNIVDGMTIIGFNFSTAPLKVGENILAFDSDGIVTLHGTKLKIYLMSNEVVRVRKFNITSEQYKKLSELGKTGKIEYNINNIKREGVLSVKLNGRELASGKPHTGLNTISFSDADINKGLNEIEFSGTGHFYITEVKIGIIE